MTAPSCAVGNLWIAISGAGKCIRVDKNTNMVDLEGSVTGLFAHFVDVLRERLQNLSHHDEKEREQKRRGVVIFGA